ncbi:MAG: REP-associated tyrosine transposase [Geminicoccaceae bacterium]
MRYRRARVPGASYFFTVVAWRRRKVLCRPEVRAALRTAFREELRTRAFRLDAIVLLPDHMHCVWTLPAGDSDFSDRGRRIKASVTRAVGHQLEAEPTASRRLKGERGLWQRRYWEHVICDEADFTAHLDYIHFNPVKHGLVERAADWPWSSLHRYVAEGAYPPGWGEAEMTFPDSVGHE